MRKQNRDSGVENGKMDDYEDMLEGSGHIQDVLKQHKNPHLGVRDGVLTDVYDNPSKIKTSGSM